MNDGEIAQAIKLRAEGIIYPDIAKILGYSPDKVFYHCEPTQKLKRKNRNKLNPYRPISDKLRTFTCRETTIPLPDFFDRFGKNPTCGLTGRPLDLFNYASYQLDHIIPKSRGGEKSIDNMQLACKPANEAKASMLLCEFLGLCQNVMRQHPEGVYQPPKLPPPFQSMSAVSTANRYTIRYKIAQFSYRRPHRQSMFMKVDDFLAKYGNVTTCYLSGQPINILDPASYWFDHILPAAGGGQNTENNLGLAAPMANQSKQDLPVQDYITLCREVLHHRRKS